MLRDDDEAGEKAWRSIVDNYGDRVELDPDELSGPTEPDDAGSWSRSPERSRLDEDPDRFVPPSPPPVPVPPRDRLLAWIGLLGAPVALLVLLIGGIGVPSWVPVLLIASFVAGFVYLVIRMPREPRDPGDDGAVL